MLKKRIIPCLDIRDGRVTKGIKFQGNIDIGDPVALSKYYSESGADELVIYDITASIENRPPDANTIKKLKEVCLIPICIGGGVKSYEDAALCLQSGAEKISLNSIAPRIPELISEISEHFGVQAVVLSIDVARDDTCPSGYRLYVHGGRKPTEWDCLQWITSAIPKGVGEICVNSIDEDGVKNGYDIPLLKMIRDAVQIPIVISGGAGTIGHINEAFECGADAALVASMVHTAEYSLSQIKSELSTHGHPMRLDY